MFQAKINLRAEYSDIDVARLSGVFAEYCVSHSTLRAEHSHTAPWVLEWIFEEAPQESFLNTLFKIGADIHDIDLPQKLDWVIEAVPERNWLEYSYSQFPAFSVGPFYIYGSHCEDPVPEGLMGLQIDASTAFGSGEHGTTKGCLQAVLDLKGQGACPWNVLDMGTGSGILAIAAWMLWKTPVFAVDHDPECIAVTKRHMEANGVPEGKTDLSVLVNDGFAGTGVQKKGPYDLIIANILPAPLKAMAADLAACADDNGYVILSGILNEQRDDVRGVYEAENLTHRKTIEIGEWTTLLLQR